MGEEASWSSSLSCVPPPWSFLLEVNTQEAFSELKDADVRKGRGTRDQIANICWIMEKGRKFQKNIYFCFIDYDKAFDCLDHSELWKILK